jgi:sugar transferase EpsL
VLPGITGWAQVHGRNLCGWEERFKLDVYYVENRSFWLDLKILWLTVTREVGGGEVILDYFVKP